MPEQVRLAALSRAAPVAGRGLRPLPFTAPNTGTILRHGVDWTAQLVKLDLNDQRTRQQAASALGMLGDFVMRDDPAHGASFLRSPSAGTWKCCAYRHPTSTPWR